MRSERSRSEGPLGASEGEAGDGSGFRVWTSGGNRWHLAGDVDLRAEPMLRAAMHDASAHGGALVLDCAELSFIDVAGIRAIVQTALAMDVPVTVDGANELLRRAWSLLDLHTAAPNVEFSG